MCKRSHGFTLIELMIVVAIIGILAAIAIPLYQNYITRSQASRVMAEAGSVKTAIETCILEGHTIVGAAPDDCDPLAMGSNLQVGDAQGAVVLVGAVGVPQVTIATTGEAAIIAQFGHNAVIPLTQPGADQLTWHRDADGSWSCTSTIPDNFKPRGCD